MKTIHLICNAHLDPIWQWTWDEGISSALSTFKSAADLADEFDYIFCHNESLLYEQIEINSPELFERIKKLVKQGKWVVAGGWYLQPDCLMPSGESIVRQIKVGQEYFYKKFGVKSEVAVNYDSFGHSIGLVQIMRKCGYKGYITARPNRVQCPRPSRFFKWIAPDGSSITVSIASSYNSRLGKATAMIDEYLDWKEANMLGSEEAGGVVKKEDREVDYVLWGVGNHGGGPSRKDLRDIAEYSREGVKLVHSSPDRLFDDNIEVKGEMRTSLVTCMPGCYSSMARIKRAHRETESLYFSVEKMLAKASLCGFKADTGDMKNALKSLLLGEFHDILPGTVVKDGEENGLELFYSAKKILKDYRSRVFLYFAMNTPVAKEGEFPLFVYNYAAHKVNTVAEFEFSLADQNWSEEFEYEPHVYYKGEELPCQQIKERSTLNLDWRKRVIFETPLEPLGMTRFSVRVEQSPKKFKIHSITDVKKSFDEDFPEQISLFRYEDSADPWAMSSEERIFLGKNPQEFSVMTSKEAEDLCKADGIEPLHITEDGKIVRIYEKFYKFGDDKAVIEYKKYKNQPFTDIKITVEFMGKNELIRARIPMPKGEVVGDGPYIVESKPTQGEMTFQKWVGVKTADGKIHAIINDCVYGGTVGDGYIELTLLRGAGYCFHPIRSRELYPKDRYLPRIDCGRYEFNFRLFTGSVSEVAAEAENFATPPYAVNVFPTGGSIPSCDVEVDKNCIVSAFGKSDDDGYFMRLWNPSEKDEKVTVRVGNLKETVDVNAYEIVSLKIDEKITVNHDEITM